MSNRTFIGLTLALLPVLAAVGARADTATDAYRAMGIDPTKVLTGTVLQAKVVPGEAKQVVAVTTYFTGKKERSEAVNVRLEVFERSGDALLSIFARDFGAEYAGGVGDGNLQLIDLDRDGISEIIASFESYEDPLIEQRIGEVILGEGRAFRTGWSGALEYDATRAARNVPRERRDRYEREFDFGSTMGTQGVTLFMNKQVIAVAGERLPQPKVLRETFPLRPREDLR